MELEPELLTVDEDAQLHKDDYVLPSSVFYDEDYETAWEQYIGDLSLRHKEHMQYFLLGLLSRENFMRETVDDVYMSNIYAMSWFYNGAYPFDSYEADKDSYLYEQAFSKMIEDEVDDEFYR
jgi:hypothetical protein